MILNDYFKYIYRPILKYFLKNTLKDLFKKTYYRPILKDLLKEYSKNIF